MTLEHLKNIKQLLLFTKITFILTGWPAKMNNISVNKYYRALRRYEFLFFLLFLISKEYIRKGLIWAALAIINNVDVWFSSSTLSIRRSTIRSKSLYSSINYNLLYSSYDLDLHWVFCLHIAFSSSHIHSCISFAFYYYASVDSSAIS